MSDSTTAARSAGNTDRKAYLVGSGIASLAAAVYLVKEGGLPGKSITIFEQEGSYGGSLDLVELCATPEAVLGTRTIEEWFAPEFFHTAISGSSGARPSPSSLGTARWSSPFYKGQHDPRILFDALKMLHRG